MKPSPIVLIIFDGWGSSGTPGSNAITAAKTPFWDKLWQDCPHTTLSASGLDVGLPKDQMGNSEVGHLTMGAGRVIYQDLTRISAAIQSGSFTKNPVLNQAASKAASHKQALHILGLLSPGGVHSHEEHIHAMVKLAARKGVENIFIHAFLDGRDTAPQSAKASLLALQAVCKSLPNSIHARIASLSGRYYAMDRDKRWDRTEVVYDMLTEGKAPFFSSSATEALIYSYNRGETDEFVKPTIITPAVTIQDEDVVVCMNFRSDRMRQLCFALTDPNFSGFKRKHTPKISELVTLTEYSKDLKASVAFPSEPLKNMLGEYCQNHQIRQLRIAETEKYAHVTFFFNGGRETPFTNEDRILIPSKKVATYDLAPEMSAYELTDALIKAIQTNTYSLIICNYANADMVGHTGNFEASVKAVETLDICLSQVLEALKAVGGEALITSDHGNVEMMFDDKTQQPHTAHTINRVPFIYVGRHQKITHQEGSLSDIAPTLIHLLGLPQPSEMTGRSLLTEYLGVTPHGIE